jgi:hypothetical protein
MQRLELEIYKFYIKLQSNDIVNKRMIYYIILLFSYLVSY